MVHRHGLTLPVVTALSAVLDVDPPKIHQTASLLSTGSSLLPQDTLPSASAPPKSRADAPFLHALLPGPPISKPSCSFTTPANVTDAANAAYITDYLPVRMQRTTNTCDAARIANTVRAPSPSPYGRLGW